MRSGRHRQAGRGESARPTNMALTSSRDLLASLSGPVPREYSMRLPKTPWSYGCSQRSCSLASNPSQAHCDLQESRQGL